MRLFLVLLICLFCTGCARNLWGTATVGGDVKDASQSTKVLISSEEISGHHKGIIERADLVKAQGEAIQSELKEEQPSAEVIEAAAVIVVDGVEYIKKEAVAAERLNSGQKKLAKEINRRAKGKTRWSWGRLALIWTIVIIALGIGLRFTPFFGVIHRLVSGVAHGIMDLASGAWENRERDNLRHLRDTETIATEDLSPYTRAAILRMEAEEQKDNE